MLIAFLIVGATVTAYIALVRRARHVSGYQAPDDPYEATDDLADDHEVPVEQPADVQPLRRRSAPAAAARRPTLPRLVRYVPIQFPPHVDKPLTSEQLAQVRERWPDLVRAYGRDSHQR